MPAQMIILTTEGDAGDYQGDKMGQYKNAGEMNEKPYYQQMHTVKDCSRERFLYYNVQSSSYVVSNRLEGEDGVIYLKNDSGDVFGGKWEYLVHGGEFKTDDKMEVSDNIRDNHWRTELELLGGNCDGTFAKTEQFRAGHPVYTSDTWVMSVTHGYVGWRISERSGENWWRDLKMFSPSCNGLSPDDQRNMKNQRNGRTTWMNKGFWKFFSTSEASFTMA